MKKGKKMQNSSFWRYQAVYIEHISDKNEKTREYSICEVYLNKKEKLYAWTESIAMYPHGESFSELCGDLKFMYDDTKKWKPVAFNSLCVGMKFKKRTNKH
ncbi:MAG: hypothetical protein LBC73_01125 [Oscillospiraceae bacterium]|nr:hypothetical protein [Oscillospiraceae bacterium]